MHWYVCLFTGEGLYIVVLNDIDKLSIFQAEDNEHVLMVWEKVRRGIKPQQFRKYVNRKIKGIWLNISNVIAKLYINKAFIPRRYNGSRITQLIPSDVK